MKRSILSPKEIERLDSLTDVEDFRGRVLSLVHSVDAALADQPAHIGVIYGARTAADQWRIFAIGRVKDENGVWSRVPGQKVYTQSTPSQSAHCFAAAADIALLSDATQEWLPGEDDLWDWYAEQARAIGLQPGRDWRREFGPSGDAAHIEIPAWRQLASGGTLRMVQ